jgi:hypothetical protein
VDNRMAAMGMLPYWRALSAIVTQPLGIYMPQRAPGDTRCVNCRATPYNVANKHGSPFVWE